MLLHSCMVHGCVQWYSIHTHTLMIVFRWVCDCMKGLSSSHGLHPFFWHGMFGVHINCMSEFLLLDKLALSDSRFWFLKSVALTTSVSKMNYIKGQTLRVRERYHQAPELQLIKLHRCMVRSWHYLPSLFWLFYWLHPFAPSVPCKSWRACPSSAGHGWKAPLLARCSGHVPTGQEFTCAQLTYFSKVLWLISESKLSWAFGCIWWNLLKLSVQTQICSNQWTALWQWHQNQ